MQEEKKCHWVVFFLFFLAYVIFFLYLCARFCIMCIMRVREWVKILLLFGALTGGLTGGVQVQAEDQPFFRRFYFFSNTVKA